MGLLLIVSFVTLVIHVLVLLEVRLCDVQVPQVP